MLTGSARPPLETEERARPESCHFRKAAGGLFALVAGRDTRPIKRQSLEAQTLGDQSFVERVLLAGSTNSDTGRRLQGAANAPYCAASTRQIACAAVPT